MSKLLFVINDAPYGNERAYNALRLAGALTARENVTIRVFLMADAVGCAKNYQKVPEGYYNIQLMLAKIIRKGDVALCGTCIGRTCPTGHRIDRGCSALDSERAGRLDAGS